MSTLNRSVHVFSDLNTESNLGWNHLQHKRIAVVLASANFLLFFGKKKKQENSHALKRQLYAYAANVSTF